MKKNEQLFDIMNDIPDEYVEDALNENAITEKRISVKQVAGTIAACAAAFAAIAAVPVLMMYVNGKTGHGDDQLPVTTDTVTEATDISTEETETSIEESSGYNTDNNDEIHETLSFGTGPERPENYAPDRKYSYCILDEYSLSDEDKEFLSSDNRNFWRSYLKNIMVNDDYADEIVSDYQSLTEEYLRMLELNEGDYELSYSLAKCSDYGVCMNGYIQIRADVYIYGSGETEVFDFMYDLVEEKKLDSSDLFYYREDYIDQIMTVLYGENYDSEDSEPERITLTGITMPDAKFGYINQSNYEWMYDIAVTGRYRDLSGVIEDKYIKEGEYEEWYNFETEVNIDDYTIQTNFENSRFHSESEINEIKNQRINRCAKVLDYLKSNHYLDDCTDKWLNITFDYDDSEVLVHDRLYENAVDIRYDTEKEEVLSVVAYDEIPEWTE